MDYTPKDKRRKRRTSGITSIDSVLNGKKDVSLTNAWERYSIHLESRNHAPETIHSYRQQIFRFFKWLTGDEDAQNIYYLEYNLAELTSEEIERYIQYLTFDKELKSSSVASALKAVKIFMAWVAKAYKIEDVSADISPVRIDTPVGYTPSESDMKKYYQSISVDTFVGIRSYTMVMLMENTGLRISSVLALNMDDVHLDDEPYIIVRHAKNRKPQKLPINSKLVKILSIYFESRGDIPESAVWVTESNQRLTLRGATYHIEKYAKLSSVPITCHALRRRFASQMVRQNVPLTVVAKYLGHSNVATLHKYHGISDEEMRKYIEKAVYYRERE